MLDDRLVNDTDGRICAKWHLKVLLGADSLGWRKREREYIYILANQFYGWIGLIFLSFARLLHAVAFPGHLHYAMSELRVVV